MGQYARTELLFGSETMEKLRAAVIAYVRREQHVNVRCE